MTESRLNRRAFVGHGAAAVLGLAVPRTALAGPQFPTRPIRIIVPFAAGGNADIIMRILADKLSARLPQRVIVENRVGAGGIVAAEAVRSSAADGHTLFVLAVGTAISVALFKSLPFDPIKDFSPISSVSKFDMLLLVQASSPIRTLDGFVAEARRQGETMNIGTTLPGSSQYLAGDRRHQVDGRSVSHLAGRAGGAAARRYRDGHRVLLGTALGDRRRPDPRDHIVGNGADARERADRARERTAEVRGGRLERFVRARRDVTGGDRGSEQADHGRRRPAGFSRAGHRARRHTGIEHAG
jgi:hypothetical protein